MQILVKARVRASSLSSTGRISLQHQDQAVKLILDRSKGQFIYAKYVFDYLKLCEEWSIDGLKTLPYGLGGAYELLVRIVDETLKRERPGLRKLLKDRLLPILAVQMEPLSLDQIHFFCNHAQPPPNYWPGWRPEDQDPSELYKTEYPNWKVYQRDFEPYSLNDVKMLLQLMHNLFPSRAISRAFSSLSESLEVFVPYHKSVVDWLKCEAGMDAGEYKVFVQWGHKILGQATVPLLGRWIKIEVQEEDEDGGYHRQFKDYSAFGSGTAESIYYRGQNALSLMMDLKLSNPIGVALRYQYEKLANDGKDEDLAKLLKKEKAYIESKDGDGATALIWAARTGKDSIVQALLDAGANKDAHDNYWRTALMWAAWRRNDKGGNSGGCLHALLEARANKEAQDKDGKTALILAASLGNEEHLQALLGAKANKDAKDKDGKTALMWAACQGRKEVFHALLEAGANKEAQDKDGKTALIWAAYEGQDHHLQALLGAKANKDAKDKDGKTALIWAAYNHRSGCVQVLLEGGADMSLKDNEGKTALEQADGDDIKAELLVRMLLAELYCREMEFEMEHLRVAETCSNLARLYKEQLQDEKKKAIPLYERALAIYEEELGLEHPDVTHTLTDLAVLHLEQGEEEVGRPLLERALDIQERSLGSDHPDVLAIKDVLNLYT